MDGEDKKVGTKEANLQVENTHNQHITKYQNMMTGVNDRVTGITQK